jgi:hypothetical protein
MLFNQTQVGACYDEMPKSISSERCKPDYEGMIKRLKAKQVKSNNLLIALVEYFEGKRATGAMAELIGEALTDKNAYQIEIDSLVKQQEEKA